MRHRRKTRQLGRTKSPRQSLLRNQATDLIMKGSIETTEAKGKELRRYVEKLITTAKNRSGEKALSLLQPKVFGKQAPKELLKKYKPKYKDRSGGYVRIIRLGKRSGDQTKMVKIEWV